MFHVPKSCMWWSSYNMVQNPSLWSISFMSSSSTTWACFHPWTNLTSMLNFIHIVISYIVMGLGFRVIWQCYQNHRFHPQWSNVNQCGESFIHDIVQFLLHNISFDVTCGQFHPCWKSHPCHEIHSIYLWHPCARAQPPTLVAHPIITSQVYSKILIWFSKKL